MRKSVCTCVTALVVLGSVGLVAMADCQEKIGDHSSPPRYSRFVVKAVVGGKVGRFQIVAESSTHELSSEFAASIEGGKEVGKPSADYDLLIGTAMLGKTKFQIAPKECFEGIDGSFGRDLFKHLALGFDSSTNETYCWPKGVSGEDAMRWVSEAPTLQSGEHKAISVALAKRDDGKMALPLVGGGGKSYALLCSDDSGSWVPTELSWIEFCLFRRCGSENGKEQSANGAEMGVVPKLDAGHELEFPVSVYRCAFRGVRGGEAQLEDGCAVRLLLQDLPTRRLVVDGQRSLIYLEKLSSDGKCSRLATRLFSWPLAVKDGAFVFDPSYVRLFSYIGEGPYAWVKVVRFGEMDSGLVLSMLRSLTPESAKKLSPFIGTEYPVDLTIEKDGKEYPATWRP